MEEFQDQPCRELSMFSVHNKPFCHADAMDQVTMHPNPGQQLFLHRLEYSAQNFNPVLPDEPIDAICLDFLYLL